LKLSGDRIVYGSHKTLIVFKRQELLDQLNDAKELLNALEERDSERSEEIMKNHVQNFVNKIKDKLLT